MILSDQDILKELKNGNLKIDPFDKKYLQPASIDLHLDKEFLVFNTKKHSLIDVKKPTEELMEKVLIGENQDNNYFILHPKEFALGLIFEITGVSDKFVGRLEGKSSLGRLGLIVHTTAGYLDPGNSLKMTLELFNAGSLPIKLYYQMPIAQMAFEKLTSDCIKPYGAKGLNSKYAGDKEVQASKMFQNF